MKHIKYIIYCRFCGTILFKTDNPFVEILSIEIKCPQCEKLLKIKEDTVITAGKKKGLDRYVGYKLK